MSWVRRPVPGPCGRVVMLLLGFLLLDGCLMRARRGEPPLVGDVDFRGNFHVSSKDLRSKIALTSSGRRFIFKFGSAYTFEPGSLRTDTKRILRIYQAHGYYQAKVTHIDTHVVKGRVNVTFFIREGLPVHITTVTIGGLEPVWPLTRQYATQKLPLYVGDVFAEKPYEAAKALIAARLRENGYLKAKVKGTVDLNTRIRTAAIRLNVEPGLQYHVGPLSVRGVIETKGQPDISLGRVKDASNLKQGELLTPERLEAARDHISAMGVFTAVDLKPDYSRQDAPITIHVKEAPFQTLEAGAGLEIDQTRQLARGILLYTNKNLGHDLQKLIAGGSLGYAFLPTIFNRQAQGVIASLQTQYIQPRIFRQTIDADVKLDYTKDIVPAVNYQLIGVRPGLDFYFNQIKGLTFAASINYDYYFNVGFGPSGSAGIVGGTSPLRITGCGPAANGHLTTSCINGYLEGQLNYDLRDNPVDPRNGAFFAFNIQYSGLPGSNFRYIRYAPEVRAYVSLPWSRNFVLAARGLFGYLDDLQGSDRNKRPPPIMSHFFAGGANSVRAAGTQLMGPLTFSVEDNTGGNSGTVPYEAAVPIPIGGDHVIEGSVELRWYSPVHNLGFAVFFDIGRVWTRNPLDVGYQAVEPGYQFGPGFGIRYRTPLGPLRLDFAYRASTYHLTPVNVDTSLVTKVPAGFPPPSLNPAEYRVSTDCPASSPTPWTCYSVPRINFYLTIGEAF